MIKNKTNNKTINSCYWAAAICLPIFIYIALMSYFAPMLTEDFIGLHKSRDNNFFAIKEAWDAFKWSYMHLAGRIHFFIRNLLIFSFNRGPFQEDFAQMITAILNGLVFLILLINLFFLTLARKPIFNDKNDRIRLFIIFILMMTILAEKGETIFWLTGRTNYLWPTTILSSLAVFFRLAFAHDGFLKFYRQPIKHFLFIAAMIPLAIVAGMTDFIAVPVVFGLLLFGFFYKIYIARKKLPLWCYIIFAFFVIGIILLFIAPGNYGKFGLRAHISYNELSIFGKVVIYPLKGLRVFLQETFYLPFLMLPIFFYWQKSIVVKGKNILDRFINKMKQDKKFAMAVIFLLATFGLIAFSGIFPRHPARAYFSGTCIFLLAALLVIDFLFLSPNKLKLLQKHIVKKSIFIISSLLFAIYLSLILILTIEFHREFKNRAQSIMAQKAAGKDIITIKLYPKKYFYTRSSRPKGYSIWHRASFSAYTSGNTFPLAEYYGVKKIVLDKK